LLALGDLIEPSVRFCARLDHCTILQNK
jgi:hypothetical protein